MKKVVASIEDYLKPTATIDCDNQLIREEAWNLTKGINDTAAKAKNLFYWVRDEIEYNPLVPLEIFESYRASETLKRRGGFVSRKQPSWLLLPGPQASLLACTLPTFETTSFRLDCLRSWGLICSAIMATLSYTLVESGLKPHRLST